MKIYGQLENASLEQLASDPAASTQGRLFTNTTSGKTKLDDGVNKRALLRNDTKLIIGNEASEVNNIRFNRAANGLIQLVPGNDVTAEGTLATTLSAISAKVEGYLFASLPAPGNQGRLLYATDTNELYVDNGVALKKVFSSTAGILPVASGGTGGSSATTGFNNLSPLTTKGDLIAHNGTDNIRVAVGANGTALVADSGQASGVAWSTVLAPDASTQLDNATLVTSVAANALTIALKTRAGADPSAGDPVVYGSRTINPASSGYNYEKLSITGAKSIVVPSGATLGHASGVDHYIYVYLYDRVSVPELAVSSTLLDEGLLYTSTAIAGGTLNSALYTTTASGTARSIRLIARILSNQAAAGTWATDPDAASPNKSTVTPFDGQLIYAEYNANSTSTYPRNATTIVNFSTKVEDSLNAVTTGASWAFTAPKAGVYGVESYLRFAAITFSADQIILYRLFKNGVNNKNLDMRLHTTSSASLSGSFSLGGAAKVSLAAGDTINIRIVTSDAGVAMPTLQENGSAQEKWITITYLGFI